VRNTRVDGKRRMQSPLFGDRNLSTARVYGYSENSGRLGIESTDDSDGNFYLECGDCLFNISNLVSEKYLKRSRSAQASAVPVSVRKERERERRIYPSRHHVESIWDVDIGMVFASAGSGEGYDGGRGPSRHSTSGYSDNSSGRNMYRSSNGIVGSRSVLINNNDTDIDYSYHRQLQVEVTTSSTIDGGSDHYQRYPNRASSPKQDLNLPAAGGQIEVEIVPGVFALLRGSEETWRAIQRGNFETVVCVCCYNRLHCIADAEYVLCPECRVVSPVGDPYRDELTASGQHISGVGLGLLEGAKG
jgi:hypothetical protein